MRRDSTRPRLVLALLIAASLGLIALDAGEEPQPAVAGARSAAGTAFGPVAAAVSTVSRPLASSLSAVRAAPGAQQRISELEERNRELTAELDASAADEKRSTELEDLLGLSGLGGYTVVPAQSVTRLGSGGYADTVTLDVGERDGVQADMTVLNGDGLVGRVVRTSHATATVLLFTDGASSVGARMEGSRQIGAVHGNARPLKADAPAVLELMQSDARIEEGDRIVTMGSHADTPFVPGVPVGTVTEVRDTPGALSRTAEVRPAADLGALDIVGVVVAAPEKDPKDGVLPPKPEADAERTPGEER
ncbi:rod shape-determining protein MreC [Nocardiopsis coralliicola]